jgi:dUTP pyrophosphatase
MNTPTIKFFKFDKSATIPTRAHPTDSGMDLYALEDTRIWNGAMAIIRTGIGAIIPKGYELQVRPRSGLSSNGIVAVFGTVDEAYRGEIKVMMSLVDQVYDEKIGYCDIYRIYKGDRIAQLVLAPVTRPTIEECERPTDKTERGEGGFGSTGR